MYQSSINIYRYIQWNEFSENATIYNPRGSGAILPKIITELDKVNNTSKNVEYNKNKVIFLRK